MRHFPKQSVLRSLPGDDLLLAHPQVRRVDVTSVAELGLQASGGSFVKSFWRWFKLFVARTPAAKLSARPHPLDELTVLEACEHGKFAFFPLSERRRALRCPNVELAKGLSACHVLLSKVSAVPEATPDAVARALSVAMQMPTAIDPMKVPLSSWRLVAMQLAKSELAEAVQVAHGLPAFHLWCSTEPCLPSEVRQMFPSAVSKELRKLLRVRGVRLNVLEEEDEGLRELLSKMNIKQIPLEALAKEALAQTQDLALIAQLVRGGVRKALVGKKLLPAEGNLGNLAPHELLLWDKETDFDVPRRISRVAARTLEGLQGKLLHLGCRTELDLTDVLDVARQVQDKGDVALALKLLQRLGRHQKLSDICQSAELRAIKWLPTLQGLMAPEGSAWQWTAKAYVGLVKPIALEKVPAKVLDALGVPGEADVDDTILHAQLAALIQTNMEADVVVASLTLIYKRLKTPPALEEWVWTKFGFQSPQRMCKAAAVVNLSPCLHRLRDDWQDLPVFRGVTEDLTPQLLFMSLTASEKLEDEKHRVQVEAVRLLTQQVETPEQLADLASQCGAELRMVSKSGRLLPVDEIFFHDMKWHGQVADPTMEEVHPDISEASRHRFGVRNLSKIVAAQCGCGDQDWLEVTGQHEPLTTRLKNILKDYPWQAIVKEMLQNAEDAGATKFKVLIDCRNRGRESLLTPQMAAWQGNCIWFYNDAVFEEKDFQALVKLGQGSKANEQGKIGRCLGFLPAR